MSMIETLARGLGLDEIQLAKLVANAEQWKQTELKQLADDISRAEQGTQLTRAGFELMGKAVAGKELRFTRVKLGDANGVTPDDDAQFEMNDLINPLFEAPITEVKHTGGGTCSVVARVQNATLEDSFRIVEVGLFALDPDTGEELLYCYRNSGTASDVMPAGGSAVLWDLMYTLITVIDKATNITAVIDGGLVYVTQTEFLQHVASTNPHPNVPSKAEAVTAATSVWVNGGDDKLHPMAIDLLGNQILGGDASNIPRMNARLTQTEINLANVFTQLKAEQDGIQGNLVLIEPFTDGDCVDKYSCDVVTAVAGIANIQIDSDRDVKVGNWYTITDGSRSEYVQVKSVARNGAAVIVILNQIIAKTYDLTRTQLLRTSALVSEGQATGAGDIRTSSVNVNETFTGTGGNVETFLVLDTSQSNAGNFTVTGDGTFNADAYFTLTA